MADSCNVPRDILESMRDVLDKRVKISIRRLVKMEIKADKLDNRVLAFSPCRLFIMTARCPTKIEASFHFLDIQALESKKPGQLVLTMENKEYKFMAIDAGSDVVDHLIMHLGLSLKQIFPSFPLERLIVKVDILPEDRMKKMQDMIKAMGSKDVGPCGGFTTMYQCMCDFHGLPYREEVAWDVDTIYLSHDSRELRLQDFDHLPQKDLIPVIAALEHNTWFKSFNASNVKLTVEACNEVIKVMRRNAVLEEIILKNTGIKTDFVQKLSTALISNSGSQLQVIDLSANLLEDKAVTHLLGALKTLTCGISSLDFSNTGISTRCINKLGEGLTQNASVLTSLTCLKLNDNGLKGEDFPMLYNCLARSNSVSTLDLSSTDCVLDSLCDPLLRGCPNLTTLKLSKTLFTHKRSKEVVIPQSWKQLFASSCCLETVDLSSCKLPAEALKELLLGVASNRNLKDLALDISSNELGSAGAGVLSSCFLGVKSIQSLDISNNGFDLELKTLLPELGKNSNLKHLSIGRNFTNIKPKYMVDVMTCLVTSLLQDESALESLSLADSRLRMDTTYVINAMGSNNSLVEIDISGNGIGDHGARMLGKALMINTKLRKVVWDKNGITAPGFEDVAEALKRNMSLRKMPFPVNDATASMRLHPDRTELALQKIESFLQRNHLPGRFTPDIAYRLQQGFLISSTQQILDRKVVQLQDSIQALNSLGSMDVYAGDVATAESLVKDADKSRQLLPGLQHIALESQSSGNTVDQQLESTSTKLRLTIEEQVKKTVEEMLKCTLSHCPTIMSKETFETELKEGCSQKTSLPKDFTKGVLEGAATDIYNMTGEMNLAVASLISDTVIDEVIESLSVSNKTLNNHLSLRKSGVYKSNSLEEDVEDGPKLSVGASPQLSNKRNSMWNRKTRPQSTMGPEALNAASAWKPPDKLQDISQESTPMGSTEMLADFGDLPLSSSKPLTHVTKSRPKPPKSVRPTRPILDTGTTELDPSLGSHNPSIMPSSPKPSSPHPPRLEVTASSDRKPSRDELPPTSSKVDQSKATKLEEGGSKPESKKWSPMSFIKGKSKEEKAAEKAEKDSKKSHSFSTGISSIFSSKKKEDKKRPSVSEAPAPASDSVDSKKESNVDSKKEKEFTDSKESDKTVELSSEEMSTRENLSSSSSDVPEKQAGQKDVTPTPVRPPRERSAILPPKEKKEAKAPTLAKAEDSSLDDEDKKNHSSGVDPDPPTVKVETEEEEEKKETAPDAPASSSGPKLPPGAVKMGGLAALGNRDLLDQLKMKQVKRKSHLESSPEEKKEAAAEKADTAPSTETNNNNNKTDTNKPETSSKQEDNKTTDSNDKETPPPSSSKETSATVAATSDSVAADINKPLLPSSPSEDTKPSVPSTSVKLPAPAPRAMIPPKRPASVVVPSTTASSSSSTTTNSSPPSESTTEQKEQPQRPERPLSIGPTPQVKPRPPPPLKPRPPIMPRPRKRDSEIEDNPDPVTSPVESDMPPTSSLPSPLPDSHKDSLENSTGPASSPPSDQSQDGGSGGIVYDSATLRLSVKDKIKRISQAKALAADAPGGGLAAIQQAKKKVASLPRDSVVPETAEEDLTKEHSSDAADGKSETDQDWVVVEGTEGGDDGNGADSSQASSAGLEGEEQDKSQADDDDDDDDDDDNTSGTIDTTVQSKKEDEIMV